MRVMPPSPQHSRIDLGELKSQISKRVGMERARSYFGYLNRFLSRKLSKVEFDKLCVVALGRENVFLHNRLMNAILRNVHQAKALPSVGYAKDGKRPILLPSTSAPTMVRANGDVPQSLPRRVRSVGVRERKIKDRPSPLGLNGKTEVSPRQCCLPNDHAMARENGDLAHCDLRRPVQVHQGGVVEQSTGVKWRERPPEANVITLHNKISADEAILREGAEDELMEDHKSVRAGVHAPLGIPFCPASVGGARRPQYLASDAGSISLSSCSYSGELCHTHILKERMDQIAEAQGLGGVTLDCANILNSGLDTYLKRLIRSCVELVGARSGNEPIRQHVYKQQLQGKVINGIWQGNHSRVQGGLVPSEATNVNGDCLISPLDFRVAMELNPQQLGEDWPLLLEKISLHSFKE